MSFPLTLPTTLQEFFDNAWRWAVIEKHVYDKRPTL